MNFYLSFKLKTIVEENGVRYHIPSPLKQFLFDYKHSKFIECRSDLAQIIRKKVTFNIKKSEKIIKSLRYLTNTLESMYKRYSILEGTLLGKEGKKSA